MEDLILFIWQYSPNWPIDSILIKIPTAIFLPEIDKLILKLTWKGKGPRGAKTILKKNEAGGLRLPWFQNLPHKAKAMNTMWHWHKDRNTEQQKNRAQEWAPHICANNLQWWLQGHFVPKGQCLPQRVLRNSIHTGKWMRLHPYPNTCKN